MDSRYASSTPGYNAARDADTVRQPPTFYRRLARAGWAPGRAQAQLRQLAAAALRGRVPGRPAAVVTLFSRASCSISSIAGSGRLAPALRPRDSRASACCWCWPSCSCSASSPPTWSAAGCSPLSSASLPGAAAQPDLPECTAGHRGDPDRRYGQVPKGRTDRVPRPGPDLGRFRYQRDRRPDVTVPEPAYLVFVPTTPNPTTGFLVTVPKRSVKVLDIPIEDGSRW